MSAIFQLPVCLTYWSRKYTTLVDPHVDNSHQVWSCDLVTLTFDFLTLSSWRTWRVTRPTLPQSLKTLRLSVRELWVITFPVGYHWKCVRGHWVCAESRDRWALGRKPLHFFGIPDPDLRIHYRLSSSPLQHFRTTVRVCDNCTNNYWNLTATFKKPWVVYVFATQCTCM